ncbi:MAG TPA: hypothetical protein VF538_09155 [Pyrinomonadaceae bacterium]|jgi:peptidoglycan/LPS O-acetylase OafA/YrhL
MNNPERSESLHAQLAPHTRWQQFWLGLLAVGTGIPALELNGFGRLLPQFDLATWACVCAAGGALAGAFYLPDRRFRLAGLLPGALASVFSLFAVYYYTQQRSEVFSIELILVSLVAMLPGILLYYFIMRGQAGGD